MVSEAVLKAITNYGNQMWLLGSGKPDRAIAARAALVAAIEAERQKMREVLYEAATLVDEYSCKTPVGHIATECEEVVRRARAVLEPKP